MERSASSLGWVVCVLVVISGVLSIWLASQGSLVLAGSCVFVCLGVAVWSALASSTCARSSARVTSVMERIAGGDYKATLEEGGPPSSLVERAAHEAVLRLKKDLGFTRGVLMGMATPCVVVDTTEVLRFTNKNLLRILQHDGMPEDFYGQNVAYFFYGDSSRPTVLGAALREGKEITKEVELVGRKGAKRNIRIDASPLYDLDGKLMGSLCVYADLTDLRVQEAALIAVNHGIASTAEQADQSSVQVAQAAQRLSGLTQASRDGADRQRRQIAETSRAMQEMSGMVEDVARRATQAAETSGDGRSKAQQGAAIVGQVVKDIGDVESQTLALKADMDALGRQAAGIGQVLGVISDIADQTNLLALNAAIEAARAGEAGRGFAVVADEVRKLAEKTMHATKEVESAILGIQSETGKNVDNVDKAVKTIARVTAQATRSGEALSEIVDLIDETSGQVRAIADASERESVSAEQVLRSMEEVNAISSDTSEAMCQASEAVDELAKQAANLRDLIRGMQNTQARLTS